MMRLPTFTYVGAKTLEDAVTALADDPEGTRLVAGGTDLWPNLKRRHQGARSVVGLRRVAGLRGITGDPAAGVTIGAMTTLTDILRCPMLRDGYPGFVRAVASISSPVLRNMGTLGGNLCLDTRCTYYNQNEEWRQSIGYCMKEVGDTCWVAPGSPRCWAVQASDSAPALCSLDAHVVLHSTAGERVIPIADLYNDDGIVYLTKSRTEILTEIRLGPAGARRSTYWKLRRRGSIDFPVLGVGVALELDGGTVSSAKIHLGAVHSFPVAATAAAAHLLGKSLTEDVIAEAAELAKDPASPLDNTDFTLQWRRRMVGSYVDGALRELAGLPPKATPSVHGEGALALEV
ncbi:MAG: FAD binding domain-containing protein [Planctomycetes bacterium]|nr:FAD binding domain-containing protein [Planctomycetota bacterium]